MAVRHLSAEDAAAYQSLRLRALQESPNAFSSSHAEEAARSTSEIVKRVTRAPDGSRCVFGSFVGDQLVGILTFVRPQSERLLHCAELVGMYVAPEFRRRGFGRALVDTALAHARSLPRMRQLKLTVNATNTAARSLYQSMGFDCFGVEPEAICVDGRYYSEEFYSLRL